MSFKDLSKIDVSATAKSGGKLKVEPESKAPSKMPVEGAPPPKKS